MDIKINNLKKMYGNKVVFENLNLQFNTGVYGILGPNGAGKSSLTFWNMMEKYWLIILI